MRLIRPKIKEIVENIDKFKLSKGNAYRYENIEISIVNNIFTLKINLAIIFLSDEEIKILREKISGISQQKQDNLLNSISFKEEGK